MDISNGVSFQLILEKILDNQADAIVSHYLAEIDKIISPFEERIVLFGAGRLGRVVLSALRKSDIQPLAFSDNNPQLWKTQIDGLIVLSPGEAADKFGSSAVFVVTIYTSAPVFRQLHDMGLSVISFPALAWKYPVSFLPHGALEHPHKIFRQSDEIREALALWADKASGKEYIAQLAWRVSLDSNRLPPHLSPHEIYFPDDIFSYRDDEVFVDCGAYNGDTIQAFLQHRGHVFKRIIAIEPDPWNCQQLETYMASLPSVEGKIRIIQSAVGARQESLQFNVTGSAASSFGNGDYRVECSTLDILLEHKKPTFIKMDIEGAEIDALTGGINVIGENLPVLAICAYHSQEHLWKIPKFVKSISERYHLFLRRYSDECWELVCYAVPENRLLR